MSKTEETLQKAISGETRANKRYLRFAKIAEKEGRPEIAKLFKATADIELNEHAQEEFELLQEEKIGNTIENLKTAIAGETYEFSEMYPDFAEVAEKEGNKAVASRYKEIAGDEKEHAENFKKELEKLKGGN